MEKLDRRSIMVILNPTSGGEDHKKIMGELLYKLKNYYKDIVFKITEKQHDATKFAQSACDRKFHSICVIGGDGTLNEVITGIAPNEYRPKLMIIPGGTVNCLARVLEIPMGPMPTSAVMAIDLERTIKVDIGKVGDKYFTYMLSIGPVSEAIHESTTESKLKFGPMAYFIESTRKLREDSMKNVRVITDEGEFEGMVDHVIVSLTNKFGKFEFSKEKLDIDDGYANVFITTEDDLLSRMSLIGDAIWSRLEENEAIKYFRTKKVRIESVDGDKIASDIDGDKGDYLPVEAEILKQHIEVFLPKEK